MSPTNHMPGNVTPLRKARSALSGVMLALACLWSGLPAEAATVKAKRADDFVDSVGVCIQTGTYSDADWAEHYEPRLAELGVRYVREGLEHIDNPNYRERLRGLFDDHGVRTLAICGPWGNDNLQKIEALPDKVALAKPFLHAIEGPNEPDLFWWEPWKYGGFTDRASQVQWYQNAMYDAIKKDRRTRDVMVTSFALAYGENRAPYVGKAIKHDAVAWHHYNGHHSPNPWQLGLIREAFESDKPGYLTEHGYNVGVDVSLKTQAKYLPRSAARFWDWNNNAKTFFFVLNAYEGWGLMNSPTSVRPSFISLAYVLNLLKEATWNAATKTWDKPKFRPRSLDYTLAGDMNHVEQRLLQKSDGDFYLLIWLEVTSYDKATGADLDFSRDLSLSFPTRHGVVEHRADTTTGEYTRTPLADSATTLDISVPDSLLILEIAGVKPGTRNKANPESEPR